MNYYNKKCLGCGNYFSNDINNPTYVKNADSTTKYCKRCFRLINYNELDNSKIDEKQIIQTLENIDYKNNLIVMILDIFDIKNSIVEQIKDKENILVLVNKLSCLPKTFNRYTTLLKIKNILNEEKINFIDIILYDSVNSMNIRKIDDVLFKYFKNKKTIYIVGKTNVGKSSLINALLKYNKVNKKLSTSPFPNTTVNLSKIDLNKYTLIDTPGYKNMNSVINYIDQTSIKQICDFKKIINKNFLIKDNNQVFFLEKLFYISVINQNAGSIGFYCSSNIKIHRTKQDKIKQILQSKEMKLIEFKNDVWKENKYILDENKKYNIFVNGICLISIKKISKIIIGVNSKIEIFITENALI
ncbi:GTPase [Malacoplasma muris]|uniref:GTPase n=1 Tax=Malacoplasma muris TaxID=2119 RepID=UPI00398EACE0